MKNMKSKVLLLLFVLCSVLILVSSCGKKSGNSVNSKTEVQAETKGAVSQNVENTNVSAQSEKATSSVAKSEEPVPAETAPAEVEEPVEKSQAAVAVDAENVDFTPVIKEEAKPEEPVVYSDTLTYKGITTTVVVTNTESTISLPEGMGLDEVLAVAELINSEYPDETALVTYELDGDTLVLYYPEQTDEFLLSVVDILRAEAMALIDAYVTDSVPVSSSESTDAVYSDTLSYRGLTTKVEVYSDGAVITIPEVFDYDDVAYVASLVLNAYPDEASLVYYDYSDGILYLTYPEQSDEYLLGVIDLLRKEAMALIDKSTVIEEKTAEDVSEDQNVLFTTEFSYNGYYSYITVTSTKAVLTIPEGVSKEDIAAVAEMVSSRYPYEASLIVYTIEDGKLVLSYPVQSSEYLKSALAYIEKEAKAILDLYPLKAEESAVTEITELSSLNVPEASESKVVTPVAPPVVVEEVKVFKGFSISAVAIPKYNFNYEANGWEKGFTSGFGLRAEAKFGYFALGLKGQYDLSSYVEAGAYLRWTFASAGKADFYALVGGGVTFGVGGKLGEVTGLVEAGLGVDYRFCDNFSLFGEVTGQYSIKKPGIEAGATVGLKITF